MRAHKHDFSDLEHYIVKPAEIVETWRCTYPGCNARDIRKHRRR